MAEQRTRPPNERILEYIERGQLAELRAWLDEYHPADIADLLDELPPDSAILIFNLLNLETASEVLDETGSLVRQELVDNVDEERLADLLDELPMDDAAEFLEDLPDPTASRLLGLMEPEEAREVQTLLRYEEESAGRLMSTDVASLRRQWTVAKALEYLRSLEEAETLHYLYVVDRHNHLIGVVPIRSLILARPEATVESVMVPSPFPCRPTRKSWPSSSPNTTSWPFPLLTSKITWSALSPLTTRWTFWPKKLPKISSAWVVQNRWRSPISPFRPCKWYANASSG